MNIFKKLLSFVRILSFKFIDLVIGFVRKKKFEKNLLLLRLDAVGDYVLFRNFIAELKLSEKYGAHKITLVGNQAWCSLAETLDAKFIERFIWLDRQKFVRNPIYRIKKLLEISSFFYDAVISPVFSREFLLADSIVQVVTAREKIGSVGDLSNIKAWEKLISDKWYTRLVPAQDGLLFEFQRNKEFFVNLLEQTIQFSKPSIEKCFLQDVSRFLLPDSFVVLFIGANARFRKWPVERFAEVANHLHNKLGAGVVLCGGPADMEDAVAFEKNCSVPFVNLVGKTNLVEFVSVLSQAVALVSNETSAHHFAVALGVNKIFVVSNGNHFGRFCPYPKTIYNNHHVIFHPLIEHRLSDFESLCSDFGAGSSLNITDIDSQRVIGEIDAFCKFNR